MSFHNLFPKTLFFLLFFSVAFFWASRASAISFLSPLKMGDSGPAVLALQKLLNSDPDTIISNVGIGSPGNESDYFGIKTKNAVVRFQEKFKSEVLTPGGLSKGTGYVGFLTMAKLNNLANNQAVIPVNQIKNSGLSASSPLTTPTAPFPKSFVPANNSLNPGSSPSRDYVSVSVESTGEKLNVPLTWNPNAGEANPNLENLNKVITEIRRVGAEQGYSSDKIKLAEQAIIEQAATTTNLKALFVKQEQDSRKVSAGEFWGKDYDKEKNIFKRFVFALSDFLMPQAEAYGGQPFGGRVMFTTLCTCSGNWLMTLAPTAPNYVTLLTHYSGMQMYLNFNVPFTMNLIGFYQSGGSPCEMYAGITCVTVPSQGMTTPTLGSS